LELFWNEVVIA